MRFLLLVAASLCGCGVDGADRASAALSDETAGWYAAAARTPTWGSDWPTGHTCQYDLLHGAARVCATLGGGFVGVPRTNRAGTFTNYPVVSVGGFGDAMWFDDPFNQTQRFGDLSAIDPTNPYTWTADPSEVDPPPFLCDPHTSSTETCGLADQLHVYLPNAEQILLLGGFAGHRGNTFANAVAPRDDAYLFNPYAPAQQGVSRPAAPRSGTQWTELPARLPYTQVFFHQDPLVWTCGFDDNTTPPINPSYPDGAGIDCVLVVGGNEFAPLPGGSFHLGGTTLAYIMAYDPVTGRNSFTQINQVPDSVAYFDSTQGWQNVSSGYNGGSAASGTSWGIIDSTILELTPACHETTPAGIRTGCVSAPPSSHGDGDELPPSFLPELIALNGRRLVPVTRANSGVNTAQILHVMASGATFHMPGSSEVHRIGWERLQDRPGHALQMPTVCSNDAGTGNRICPGMSSPSSTANTASPWAEDDFQWNLTAATFNSNGQYRSGKDIPVLVRGEALRASSTQAVATLSSTSNSINNPVASVAQSTFISPGAGGRLGALSAAIRTGRIFVAGGLAQLIDYAAPDSENYGARRSALLLKMTDPHLALASWELSPSSLIEFNGYGLLVPLPASAPDTKEFLVFGGLNRELTATNRVFRLTCATSGSNPSCAETPDRDLDFFPTTRYQTFNQGYTNATCAVGADCNSGICANGLCISKNAHQFPYEAVATTIASSTGNGSIFYASGYDNQFAIEKGTYIESDNTLDFADVAFPGGYVYPLDGSRSAPTASADPSDPSCGGFDPLDEQQDLETKLTCALPNPGVIDATIFADHQARLKRVLTREAGELCRCGAVRFDCREETEGTTLCKACQAWCARDATRS